jgi:hypothetical protein
MTVSITGIQSALNFLINQNLICYFATFSKVYIICLYVRILPCILATPYQQRTTKLVMYIYAQQWFSCLRLSAKEQIFRVERTGNTKSASKQ